MKVLILISILMSTPAGVGLLDYDRGVDIIRDYIKGRDFENAEDVLRKMLEQYPDNTELLSILARVLSWQKRYDESIEFYGRILKIKDDDVIRMEREGVVIERLIHEADLIMEEDDTDTAELILRFLFDAEKKQYESGYKLGMLYIKRREYDKAVDVFQRLKTIFPQDRDFIALYIESLILNGDIKKAKEELYALPEGTKDYLYKEREDLFYRTRKEYLKLSGSFFNYTGDYKDGHDLSLETSLRFKDITFVLTTSYIHRYGLHDSQIGLDIYSKLGEKTKRWGYLSFSISPDAEFLPKTTFGGEIYEGYKEYEFSIGYRRMNFRDASVDIFIPGIVVYLPYGFSLNERLYIVPKNDSYSLLSTLYYEPDHRFRGFYSMAIGKTAEKIGSLEDIQKLTTFSNRLGAEYRFNPLFSLATELSYEYRHRLYENYGLTLFTRYWW